MNKPLSFAYVRYVLLAANATSRLLDNRKWAVQPQHKTRYEKRILLSNNDIKNNTIDMMLHLQNRLLPLFCYP